ncbi:MAG: peptidylprolyl isomerase [Deltaproteobacteria bacterium]|jgi:peptidyl-prolyl cis-trans isomerase A (cyclophilin A)|nr:peptidylprolyl isomerase [Deltaproteobacteria bacterium]MBW2530769.1 peptidylprolyl isomerase [Deltaproteobacteria bacterium]
MKFPPIDVPGDGALHAKLVTSEGVMIARLEDKRAPTVVANFVGLAMGRIDYKDPKTGKTVKGQPFYDGLLFHRIVRNFVIQCGDPLTRYPDMVDQWGTGGPGYKFADEFHDELRHNRAGVMSMANSGPNTNGSQWFITEVPTPHLDQRHSAFGLVIGGQDVIKKIANMPTEHHRPTRDVLLKRVEIFRQ